MVLLWSVSKGTGGFKASAQSVKVWDKDGEFLMRHTTPAGTAEERRFDEIGEAIDYARHYADRRSFDVSNPQLHASLEGHDFGPI